MANFELIFDNGGGITLQTERYCHLFSEAKDAAQCVSDLMEIGECSEYWDGNEPDARMQYDPNAENRGECNWISECEVLEAVGHMDPDERETWLERIGGHSEREFFRILFQLRDKASSQQ